MPGFSELFLSHLRTGLERFSPQPHHFLSDALAFSCLSNQLKLPRLEGHFNVTLPWHLETWYLATTFIFVLHFTLQKHLISGDVREMVEPARPGDIKILSE